MNRFCRENLSRLDTNQKAQYATTAAAKWLDFRLQMLGVAMVTGVAFVAVLEHHFHTVNPGKYSLFSTGCKCLNKLNIDGHRKCNLFNKYFL